LEEAVDFVGGVKLAPVDGEEILALLYVDAGLRKRRMKLRVPIFAVENARKAVAAVLERIIGAEHSDFHCFQLRLCAASDIHVQHVEVGEHVGEEIGEIRAAGDAVKEWRVRFFGGLQIES